MTLQEFDAMLKTIGLPYRYRAFSAKEKPVMPFILYQELGSDNFGADNVVWHSGRRIQVDLLAGKIRRLDLEKQMEDTFTAYGVYWEREVEFDNDETFYRVTYEVVI